MIFIFPLGIRAWINENMIYSNKFEVNGNRETRTGKICIYSEKKRKESDIYMVITNANCMSGDVYEYDILKGPDEKLYIVYFDTNISKFVGHSLSFKNLYIDIVPEMFEYEVIGNPLENPELLEGYDLSGIPYIEKLLEAAIKPIDYSRDVLNVIDESEIDFDESDEEAENDIKADIIREGFNISLVLDKSAKIVPMLEGEITDEYVDWVYSLIEGEEKRKMEQVYIIDESIIYIYVESEYDEKSQIGAYAFMIEYDGYEISDSGQSKNISNEQTAELNAVVKALCTINSPSKISLNSTSKYVISPFHKGWIYQWEKNGWKKGNSKEKIKNSGLFSKLLKLSEIHDIDFSLIENTSNDKKMLACKTLAQNCIFS